MGCQIKDRKADRVRSIIVHLATDGGEVEVHEDEEENEEEEQLITVIGEDSSDDSQNESDSDIEAEKSESDSEAPDLDDNDIEPETPESEPVQHLSTRSGRGLLMTAFYFIEECCSLVLLNVYFNVPCWQQIKITRLIQPINVGQA